MKQNGLPDVITTDKLAPYKTAFKGIGVENRQQIAHSLNNRRENSQPRFVDNNEQCNVSRAE